MSEENDESVVQSTQAELAYFLVIIFVMLLGFEAANDRLKAGNGIEAQGTPVVSAAKEEPKVFLPIVEGAPVWQEGAVRAVLKVKSCKVEYAPSRRSFILPIEQKMADGRSTLIFAAGKHEISNEIWDGCLNELFQAVLGHFLSNREEIKYVAIQGHSSSEWNGAAGCQGIPGTANAARAARVSFKCNQNLSLERAGEVYEIWYMYNERAFTNGWLPSIPPGEFPKVFFTEGKGSLELVRDAQGQELKSASRRVEFAVVPRE